MNVLEINDAGIVLTVDGEVRYAEPGVAFVTPEGAEFGHAALAKSRLHPRQTHSEFWQRLNADAVTPAGRGVSNQADLVYRQLLAIRAAAGLKGPCPVVVAASAATTPAQLAMLLGIAKEASFAATAIVDAAVAGAAMHVDDACQVLDVGLHRAVLTRLDAVPAPPRLRRGSVDVVPAAGFSPLLEGWVDAVADRFVESARFDPLRIAETEQQVFDQVSAGIERADAEFGIGVRHGDTVRDVHVPERVFAEKSAQRYELLARAVGAPTTLAVTDRARKLPGLAAFLQAAGHALVPMPADAVARAVQAHQEAIAGGEDGGGARLVTTLPCRQEHAPADAEASLPTHLLCGAVAMPLGAETTGGEHPSRNAATALFRLRRDAGGVVVAPERDAPVLLNGAPIASAQPVRAGDVLHCAGSDFQLIAVVESGRGDRD